MMRICLVGVGLVAALLLGTPSTAGACTALPNSIQVDERFTPGVEALLRDSPTFARQCGRIMGEALVAIRTLPKGDESCCRARSTIRRYDSGMIIAIIELPALRTEIEYAELLGHEFEHVLEQIEGIDVGVHGFRIADIAAGSGSAFETERARRAGATVAGEVADRR